MLPHHLPWYIVGPLIGPCPVVLYAVANKHLGSSGAYAQAARTMVGKATKPWRAYHFIGLVVGTGVAALLQGGPRLHFGYRYLAGFLPIWAAVGLH